MDGWMIAILVFAVLAGNVILFFVFSRTGKNEVELESLARERGWRYKRVKSTSRAAGYTELCDPDDDWSLKLYPSGSNGSRHSVWTDSGLGIETGIAVYAPPMPEKTQKMINLMQDKVGDLGSILLRKVFQGLGPEAVNLRTIEDDDAATLMASPGAEGAFDQIKGEAQLSLLNQFGENFADVPFFIRSSKGLSLRINKRLATKEAITEFIETGQIFARKFGR